MAKKERKPIVKYLISSATMYAYMLVFSLFGLIFLADTIWAWVRIVMGIVFLLPPLVLAYFSGSKEGEKKYKFLSRDSLLDIKNARSVKINYAESLLHTVFFSAPMLILIVVSVIAKNTVVRGIVGVIYMSVTVLLNGVGVDMSVINAWSLLYYIPPILLTVAVFSLGYIIACLKLKRQQADIVGELRSFDI